MAVKIMLVSQTEMRMHVRFDAPSLAATYSHCCNPNEVANWIPTSRICNRYCSLMSAWANRYAFIAVAYEQALVHWRLEPVRHSP